MKTIVFAAVIGLCGLVFLMAITGLFDYVFNPQPEQQRPEEMPDRPRLARINYIIWHPKIENKEIFRCEVSSGAEEEPTEEEAKAGVVAKYKLRDLLLSPGVTNPEDPAVTITAGQADLFRYARFVGKEETPYFLAQMSNGVSIEASQRTSLVVSSEEMHYWQDLREIHADSRVNIHDRQNRLFHLAGEGLDGMLDFRSMIVRRSSVAYIAGGAFEHGNKELSAAAGQESVTRVTCSGPVAVRRFEKPQHIRAFLVDLETLASFGPDEASVAGLLAALQTRMLEEDIRQEDHDRILKAARKIIEETGIPQGQKLLEGDAGKTLVRALYYMQYVSPHPDAQDLALLRDLRKKLEDKEIDPGPNGSLTIITFEKDVLTATRSAQPDLAALAQKEDSAAFFSPPFVDSFQQCDRMVIYCREEATAEKGSAAGIEPMKIEMEGFDRPVVMKSYEPRDSAPKELAVHQQARRAAVYTERRFGKNSEGKDVSKLAQKRLILEGEVYVQRLERRQEQKDETRLVGTVYEAWGERLEWERDSGSGRLTGSPGKRPTLTYSSAPSLTPHSLTNGKRSAASVVDASAAESITMSQPDDKGTMVVRLVGDVTIERNEIASDGKKRRDALSAAAWTEMAFQRSLLRRSETSQSIFSNLDSMRALGRVHLNTGSGEAWGDYLVHKADRYEEQDVETTTLYKITEQNRQELLGDEPFAPGNWPLRAVMFSRGGSEFLGAMRDDSPDAQPSQTYTTACDGEIRYIHFPQNAPLAGKTIFLKNVRITRTDSKSSSPTTLEAAESAELDFVSAPSSQDNPDRAAVDASRLFAKGGVNLSEPVEKRDASRTQEAKADTLTWQRLDAEAAGGKPADRVILRGEGSTAPEVRYIVKEKVDVKQGDRVVDTVTQEESTVITCSPDGGCITVLSLQDPKQAVRPEDNYVVADKDARVRRTGATIDSAGKRREDDPWDVRARKITTYYLPATEKGTSSRVKKIVTEGDVVAGGSRMTATADHGEWERFYRADIVERTTLVAAPGGAAEIRLLSKDNRERPVETKMRCADRIVFERTIYDEAVSPRVAAKTTAVLTNTVRVDHLAYVDRDDKLNQDVTLTCDRLDIRFSDTLRESGSDQRMDVDQMTAAGSARYQVFQLLKKEHRYPDEMVLRSEGTGGYIEYSKPGAGGMVGQMRGRKNERGEYVEKAERYVYRYDNDTRKQTGKDREHGNELPPAVNWEGIFKGME